MATLTNIVGRARTDLNDAGAVRWTDADLLTYANEALAIARTTRPDLFMGRLLEAQAPLIAGDTFPLPMVYEGLVVHYVAGRAHLRDTEFAMSNKSAPLYQLFKAGLLQP